MFSDNSLSMDQYISHLCRSAHLAIRQIASICRYLTEKNTVQLVYSFVLSRLDYCKATLAGLPVTHIARLQRIQNSAVRLVLKKKKKKKKDGTSYRFSNNYTGFRLKHILPTNLQHLLLSSNERLLRVPLWKLKSFGYRSFAYQGPVFFNSLPTDLSFLPSLASCKSKQKPHLFKTMLR